MFCVCSELSVCAFVFVRVCVCVCVCVFGLPVHRHADRVVWTPYVLSPCLCVCVCVFEFVCACPQLIENILILHVAFVGGCGCRASSDLLMICDSSAAQR